MNNVYAVRSILNRTRAHLHSVCEHDSDDNDSEFAVCPTLRADVWHCVGGMLRCAVYGAEASLGVTDTAVHHIGHERAMYHTRVP